MSNCDDMLRNLFNSDDTGEKTNSDSFPISDDTGDRMDGEGKGGESNQITKVVDTDDDDVNDNDPITSKDIQFVSETISKQAPYDKMQIRQIFYGICSSQTSTKIHHNINSKKSGDGKTYLLELVLDLFPDSFILKFNNISDKALYHQSGIEAVKNEETGKYEELSPILKKLESEKEWVLERISEENAKVHQKDKHAIKSHKSQIKDIEKEITDLKSKAVKIIDLDDKAFIFLDTPNEGLFNNLMSILSQDAREQLYIFTDKDKSGKHLQARTVLLRGSPLIMTTQVVDDTRNYRFQEKNRRFIHVNPDTTENKIEEAMRQMSTRLGGLPDDFESIVSAKDIEKSKEIVNRICNKLKSHAHKCQDNDIKGNGVKIPYSLILYSSLSSSDSWSMTVLSRLLNYIALITKVNMDSRPKVVDNETGVSFPISIYDDLKEALEIMRTASLSIRPYQQDWYANVFLPAFGELGPEPNCKKSEYGNVIARESVVGLSTKQIADKMSQQGTKTSTGNVYESYLRPLTKQGIINSVQSVINGKEYLYYPVNFGDVGNSTVAMLPLTDDCRLILNKPFDEKKIIEESLRTLLGRRSNEGGSNSKYKIVDVNGSELTLDELIEKYFFSSQHLTSCSVILTKSYNNTIEQYSIDVQTKASKDNEDKEQDPYDSANDNNGDFTKCSTEIATTSNPSIYPFTIEKIEEFFASDFGQQKEHSLEESVCRPLIGKQGNNPFLYFCKMHPNVENIHLESIEDHIRLKNSELHKAKLLELLRIEKDKNDKRQHL